MRDQHISPVAFTRVIAKYPCDCEKTTGQVKKECMVNDQ